MAYPPRVIVDQPGSVTALPADDWSARRVAVRTGCNMGSVPREATTYKLRRRGCGGTVFGHCGDRCEKAVEVCVLRQADLAPNAETLRLDRANGREQQVRDVFARKVDRHQRAHLQLGRRERR